MVTRKGNRAIAGIGVEQLGDAHVGCYCLLYYLTHDEDTEAGIGNIVEVSNLKSNTIELLHAVYEGTVEKTK